jgi:hypothetical protein
MQKYILYQRENRNQSWQVARLDLRDNGKRFYEWLLWSWDQCKRRLLFTGQGNDAAYQVDQVAGGYQGRTPEMI